MKKISLLIVLFLLVLPIVYASQNCNYPGTGQDWYLTGDVVCDDSITITNSKIYCQPNSEDRYSLTFNGQTTIQGSQIRDCGTDKEDLVFNGQLILNQSEITNSVPLTVTSSNSVITENIFKRSVPVGRTLLGSPSMLLILEGSTGNTIYDNDFLETGKGSFDVKDKKSRNAGLFTTAVQLKNSEADIEGNTFDDSVFGLSINGNSGSVVYDNDFQNIAVGGLLVTNHNGINISSNRFTNIGLAGFALNAVNNAVGIDSNTFTNTPSDTSCPSLDVEGYTLPSSSMILVNSNSNTISNTNIIDSRCVGSVFFDSATSSMTNLNVENSNIDLIDTIIVSPDLNIILLDSVSSVTSKFLVDIAVRDSSTNELIELADVEGFRNIVTSVFQTQTHSLIEDYEVVSYIKNNTGFDNYNDYKIEASKEGYETNSTIESVTMPNQVIEILLDEEASNVPPVADIGGPYHFYFWEPMDPYGGVELDFSGSYDPDNMGAPNQGIIEYIYDCGEGNGERSSTSPIVMCVYEYSSVFTATLKVKDNEGVISPIIDSTDIEVIY